MVVLVTRVLTVVRCGRIGANACGPINTHKAVEDTGCVASFLNASEPELAPYLENDQSERTG